MRAIQIQEFAAPLEVGDRPVPEPGEAEVRVRVRAASVNGFDLAATAGYLKDFFECRFPMGVGKDFAGEVDAVGAGVSGYAVGDRVFGVVTKAYLGDGSFAEYVCVPVSVGLAHLPDGVDLVDGGALGLAGTAGSAAFDAAAVRAGHIVLVLGATGGVGNLVVQLAAAAGARVIASAATEGERALVSGLGAGDTVDHTADLVAQVRELAPDGVDAVVHLAGDTSTIELVRAGGRFVSTLLYSPDQLQSETVTVVPIYGDPTPSTLDRVAAAHAAGQTRLVIQERFPLERTADAFACFAQGTLGKVSVVVD